MFTFTTIAIMTGIAAYLIGSANTSVILSKSIYGEDIRDSGSGNAGATNMLRTHGAGIAIATLICDLLKGSLVVLLANWLDIILTASLKTFPMTDFEYNYLFGNLKYIAGLCVVLGHNFPVWFGFRGGKGVATSLGVILALNWIIGLTVLIIAILIMIFSRYVSLGSIIGATVYPFILLTYIVAGSDNPLKSLKDELVYIIMAFLLSFMLILKHHANIKRLKAGNENKLFAKKSDDEYDDEEYEDEDEDEDDEEYEEE